MTNYTWASPINGDWNAVANWGPNGLPTSLDNVRIATPGVTVTVDTAASAYSLNTLGSQFHISAGATFTTVHSAVFNGDFVQTGGTYTMSGMGAQFLAPVDIRGGKIEVLSGALQIVDGGILSGVLAGAGVLDISGNDNATVYLNAGFSCQLSAILLENGAKLGLNTNFASAHNLTANNAIVDLFGHSLALNNTSVLSGVIGDGILNVNNTLTLGTAQFATTLDNGLNVNVINTAIQGNALALGVYDSGAKIAVGKAAHYDINGNWNITDASLVGSITNAGVFAKTGGGKVARIDVSFTNTGTLQANIGELRLNGLVNSLGGAVSGAGTLGIAGGQTVFGPKLALSVAAVNEEGGVLVLNGPLTYAGEWDLSGGVLNLNSASAVLTLSGGSGSLHQGGSDFDGGRITSYGGTLVISGQAEMGGVTIGGPTKINVTGSVDQDGFINFGQSSNPLITVAAGASWIDEGDGSIFGLFGNFVNNGVFSDPNGSGHAVIQTNFTSTGTIISNSTLTLAGGDVLGGTLTGNGLIDIGNPGNGPQSSVLSSGIVVTVAELDISSTVYVSSNIADANAFTEFNSGLIDLGGYSLSLGGVVSLANSFVSDGGTLVSTGQATLNTYNVEGGAELLISGTADQVGTLNLTGSAGGGTLGISAGATYTDQDDFANPILGGIVDIAGTLAENGTGIANINSIVNLAATGDIAENGQTLTLLGGGSLAGTLSGPGRITLDAGTFTLASGLSLASAGFGLVSNQSVIVLTASQSYSGDFTGNAGAISLGANTLTLSGTANLGEPNLLLVNGSGSLAVNGAATLDTVTVLGSATLAIGGQVQQTGRDPGRQSARWRS